MSFYSRNPHFDRSDIDIDRSDADEAADRHDAFLRKLAEDEYWVRVRAANATFQHEAAAAKYALTTREQAAKLATADQKFTAAIAEACAAKPLRIAELRAKDVGRGA